MMTISPCPLVMNALRDSCGGPSWDVAARSYLERLGAAEYAAFKASKPRKRDRFSPSSYHRALIECLNTGDEIAFKNEKMLRGSYSALGV